MTSLKHKLLHRFNNYVRVDTQSDEFSETTPSTKKQYSFAESIAKELVEIGLKNVSLDDKAYVMGRLPSNTKKQTPVIGFISHMDTSPDLSGSVVNPQVFENYHGKDLVLNPKENIILSPKDFPELLNYRGKTLITTDGTTLLGADDKAGMAEIITAMEYLVNHPEIEHGEIRVAFTPDEEIGRGADHFDVEKFGADYAYTLDGGGIGELEYENFNAALATITIRGLNVHPGTAKNRMLNSMHIANEFQNKLPSHERPEHTEGYEGFFHLIDIKGEVENTTLRYLVRDHDESLFEEKKEKLRKIAESLNRSYPGNPVKVEIHDQYYNMKKKVEPVFHIVEKAKEAMKKCGIEPRVSPIRGGTDGSRLSYMGLPCPNLFTGGHNYHSKYEFIPLESMEKAVQVILEIAKTDQR